MVVYFFLIGENLRLIKALKNMISAFMWSRNIKFRFFALPFVSGSQLLFLKGSI